MNPDTSLNNRFQRRISKAFRFGWVSWGLKTAEIRTAVINVKKTIMLTTARGSAKKTFFRDDFENPEDEGDNTGSDDTDFLDFRHVSGIQGLINAIHFFKMQ